MTSLLPLLFNGAHGLVYLSRGGVVRMIAQTWWSPNPRAAVNNQLSKWVICAEHISKKHQTADIGHILSPDGVFRRIIIDFICVTNQQESIRAGRLSFSRWVWVCSTASSDANTVAKFLKREVIPRFSIPEEISSDIGGHFDNLVMKRVGQALRIKHKLWCLSPAVTWDSEKSKWNFEAKASQDL